MRVILIFVDGLGLGARDVEINPCAAPDIRLLSCFENGRAPVSVARNGYLIPTEATLDIPGLPQSATGQATLFTGVNCARLLGRHLEGYPNEELRTVMREKSILKQVKDSGLAAAFINAYRPLFFQLKEKTRWRLSATTVANLSAGLPFFGMDDLVRRRAVYHDMTNESLIAKGFEVPAWRVEDAADILARAAETHDLVLYEYFLTDRAGHSRDIPRAQSEISKLDRFLEVLLDAVNLDTTLVLLTSDHGNIEDMSVKTHTRNQVMTLAWGRGAARLAETIRTLEDITPALLVNLGIGP